MNESKIRILFVDDEENNLKAFKSTFRREMEVFLATSGKEALELLEQEQVDVIVSDQRMPGMTGSEFLTIAKEKHPRAMRMLLTGFADMEAVVAAVNDGGIFAYATKPWDVNDLTLKIRQAAQVLLLKKERESLLDRYQQIFDTSGDPIIIVDHTGRVLQANLACSKLLGVSVPELQERGFSEHIEDPSALVRSLRKHRIGDQFANVDLTLRTASGSMIDCLMTATYSGVHPSGSRVFQAVIKNITDRKQEEHRIRKLNADLDKRVAARTAQLLEALEDLGSFSYTVAHDLRSPLKNIAALSEHVHAMAQKGDDEDQLQCTERLQKGAEKLLNLVDDLLRFSQTNVREMDRREVLLRPLVEEVVAELVPEQRLDQVRVVIGAQVKVQADAPMLKVALTNLISNALKFSRDHVMPEIVVGSERREERDIIYVKDNGVGFDPLHKEQAFGAFKRLHKAEQFEGTGVGLAIVSRVVSKHGGEVWADSAVGKGTTIHIALPIEQVSSTSFPFVKVA